MPKTMPDTPPRAGPGGPDPAEKRLFERPAGLPGGHPPRDRVRADLVTRYRRPVATPAREGDLPGRGRAVLPMRFSGNRTRPEIAATLGISQVHVSRLQARACSDLRERLEAA